MAVVATNVLHNVGNVLNSVNVSAGEITRVVHASKSAGLEKAMALWREQPDPVRFLTDDPRGARLVEYLSAVSKELAGEQGRVLGELELLTKNIEHIKTIVSKQQSLAKAGGLIEDVSVTALLEDAISMNAGAYDRHRVTIVRELAAEIVVSIDRHKLLQIVMNLLSNAKHAVEDLAGERRITLRTRLVGDGAVAIEVEDNGVGISTPNLSRVFNHGFTTKPDGHGFGLHASACAALEMAGTLSVHSDGPGCGARFTVVVPRRAPEGPPPGALVRAAPPN
jgi:two-component system, NtrC family, sensor kinase